LGSHCGRTLDVHKTRVIILIIIRNVVIRITTHLVIFAIEVYRYFWFDYQWHFR